MKPELSYGKKDIRYCNDCAYWNENVYELDVQGRKKLIHEGTPKQMEDTIVKLLEQWQKKRNRDISL